MLAKIGFAVVIAAVMVVGGIFFKGYLDESGAEAALQKKIDKDSNAAAVLLVKNQKLETEVAENNKKITEILADIDAVNAKIPPVVNPNVIIEKIITLGDRKQVTVIPLTTRSWSRIKVGEHEYQVFRMDINVQGLQPQVISFVDALQVLEHQPLIIESLSLKKTEPGHDPIPSPSPASTLYSPRVATVAAANIMTDSAILYGDVRSLGLYNSSLAVVFQYGETETYGSTTDKQIILTTGIFSTTVKNLQPGKMYHFRAKADGMTTVFGDNMVFWTRNTPPPPTAYGDTSASISLAVYAR